MKLKLEHLAPYLPYELMAVDYFDGIELKRKIVPSNIMGFVEVDTRAKPILRPLSDLTKEIEHNGEKFVPIEYLNKKKSVKIEMVINSANEIALFNGHTTNLRFFEYCVIEKLLEWHFDFVGLIEQKLAIDINTLNK